MTKAPPPNSPLPVPLGGFFAQEPLGPGNLALDWGVTRALAWENATSALAALVGQMNPGRVWLPGYLCHWTLAAVPDRLRRFFPLDADLSPDLAALSQVQPGDLVLAVNLFGRAPGPAWRAFVSAHPSVIFVEDCAQALDSGESPWGDWRLYSPRKLMGVAEGGLLVACSPRAVAIQGPADPSDPGLAALRRAPQLARATDPLDNRDWPALHDKSEASFGVSARAMDLAAFDLLMSQDLAAMAQIRRRNFAALAGPLADLALLPVTDPGFAPFGFPIHLPARRRDTVLAALHTSRIFAAVHWRQLAGNTPTDLALAASLITLPCDHRYGLADMSRMAKTVQELTQ